MVQFLTSLVFPQSDHLFVSDHFLVHQGREIERELISVVVDTHTVGTEMRTER